MATSGDPAGGAVPNPSSAPADIQRTFRIAGGIVAHNEERNVARAVRSLLDQDLPEGVTWSRIWVVASGCTDRTIERAEEVARHDARVSVVIERERNGKARALREVFTRAEGDAVVLLNADAVAEPGAVRELIARARGSSPPYAVMARPVVANGAVGTWPETLSLMWDLHHEFHVHLQSHGGGAHLSDELLLVSLQPPPSLPDGIINDGSYLGVWLAQHRHPRLYAVGARVTVDLPWRLEDHLRQRRRIHVGNSQVASILGARPSTLAVYALRRPKVAFRIWRRSIRSRNDGVLRLVSLWAAEIAATLLSVWDRLPPARDHVHWERIRPPGLPDTARSPDEPMHPTTLPVTDLDRRVRTLLDVAAEFDTGIPLERLAELLPTSAPSSVAELEEWLRERPEVARLEGGCAYASSSASRPLDLRQRLGHEYRAAGRRLVLGPLRFARPWVRCIGISGSASYGEPHVGDDLDFFVVTRTGAVWVFLALTYVSLRLAHLAGHSRVEVAPCFNYVLDDRSALEEFDRGRGFLFARESLSVMTIEGDAYYRGLLARSGWIAREIPRLYRTRTEAPGDCRPVPAALPVRVLNALAFVPLAAYLQLMGLRRNFIQRRGGTPRRPSGFLTMTGPRRVAIVSQRFEELRRSYDPGGPTVEVFGGSGGPARMPTAR